MLVRMVRRPCRPRNDRGCLCGRRKYSEQFFENHLKKENRYGILYKDFYKRFCTLEKIPERKRKISGMDEPVKYCFLKTEECI